jgi:hypothetical protein
MKTKLGFVMAAGVGLAICLLCGTSFAQVPNTLSYQGILTDTAQTPEVVENGLYTLSFSLYNDDTDGLPIWTEEHTNVSVFQGRFHVILGSIADLDTVDFDQTYWLGISVDGGNELPRIEMTSSAYSLNARSVMDGAVTTESIMDSAVTTGKLRDGAVTTDKILDTTIQFSDIGPNGADSGQVIKFDGTNWVAAADNDSVAAGGDDDWTVTGDVVFTNDVWGIARSGAVLFGDADSTHVNVGVACTTGTDAQSLAYATVGGGYENAAAGQGATVAGGQINRAGGEGGTVSGGVSNSAGGTRATISGGYLNVAGGSHASVGGGWENEAGGDLARVGGGRNNAASGKAAAISGGIDNTASGDSSFVGGGNSNTVGDVYATVGGGSANDAGGVAATISGGRSNDASRDYSTISGGYLNTASELLTTVAGGQNNTASGEISTVSGGIRNTASGDTSFVGGGSASTASGTWATIGGGSGNSAGGVAAAIAGGRMNTASFDFTTIGGGLSNTASEVRATIAGGQENLANGRFATIAGGTRNTASGDSSFVGGGAGNTASGNSACVVGGALNTAGGALSFAGGYRASAAHNGCFVWGDSTDAALSSTARNQFLIRASGGVGIGTPSPDAALHVVGDVHVTGKLTSDGGVDPPYMLYDRETRQAIIKRVAEEVPADKQDGAVMFWNGELLQMEIYLPARGEFRDLQGKLLETVPVSNAAK